MRYGVYSLSTYAFDKIIECHPDLIDLQVGEGQGVMEVGPDVQDDTHTVDPETLEPVLKPISEGDLLRAAREHRNSLLNASDWTQVVDNRLTPEKREEWRLAREQWRAVIDDLKAGIEPRAWVDPPAE